MGCSGAERPLILGWVLSDSRMSLNLFSEIDIEIMKYVLILVYNDMKPLVGFNKSMMLTNVCIVDVKREHR